IRSILPRPERHQSPSSRQLCKLIPQREEFRLVLLDGGEAPDLLEKVIVAQVVIDLRHLADESSLRLAIETVPKIARDGHALSGPEPQGHARLEHIARSVDHHRHRCLCKTAVLEIVELDGEIAAAPDDDVLHLDAMMV